MSDGGITERAAVAAVAPAGHDVGRAPVAPSRAPSVRWERLWLRGFGRHRDLQLEFPAGLATWVAPNEAGKSTAVLGLVATVWGLPHLQDPNGFAWARFRAFDGGPHRGEVSFARGGERYTIAREFDTHRVRVVHHRAAGDEVVLDADHNPNARREASPYLPWLSATLGLADAELVLATFVVAQGDLGGPAHELGHDVQALVAGAGGGTWSAAQARLEADLRARTRRVKGLAPGLSRDGRQDQALERAEARLRDLEAALVGGSSEADAFVRAQVAVAEADAAVRAADDESRRLRAAAEAQRAWVERREVGVRALRRAAELERAWEAARKLADEAAASRQRADGAHPELADVAEGGFEERVAAWSAALTAEVIQRERLAAAERTRDAALRRAHDAVAAALQQERQAATGSRGDRDPVAHPARDGVAPAALVAEVAAVEAAARRWREALATYRRERGTADAAAAEAAPLAPLERLAAGDRADLHGYREQVAAWAARLTEVEAAWQAWRERLDDARERYGEVAGLAAPIAADLVAFARAVERPEPLAPWRWVGALAFAAAAAGGAWWAGWNPWWPAAAAGVAWVALWPRRPALRRARRRLDAHVAAGLTVLDADDDRRLELARRREAYDVHRRDLVQWQRGEREAADRLAEAEAGAAAFRARWAPLRDALIAEGHGEDVDLGEAHARFERVSGALVAAEVRAEAACRALGVDDAAALAPGAPAATAGLDAARALAWGIRQGALAQGAAVAELEGWLARLSAATWTAWREVAEHNDASERRRVAARDVRARAEEEAARVAIEHERAVWDEERALATARAALRDARAAALAGARLDDPDLEPAALRQAWRERAASAARATTAAERLDAHLQAVGAADPTALAAAVEAAGWEASEAVRSWRDLVVEHPSLPPADLEASIDPSVGPGATFAATRAAAEEAARRATATERAARDAHEALARAQGGDPIDVAATEVERIEARAEVERIGFERDALALAATELAAAVEVYRATHLRTLEAATGARLARFGATPGRRVRFDDAFRAGVVEADGRPLAPGQLSQGARDQLALALRWSIADVMADDVGLPLVLDDPFLNWDADRSTRVADALRAAAAEGRQVWLLSHRAEMGAWGEPVRVVED